MKLRDDDKKWLSDEIAKQLDASIAKALDSFRPRGFRRVAVWLKEWGAITLIWAVPSTLLAAVIALGIAMTNRISSNATFQGTTTSDITQLKKDVGDIKKALAAQQLISQASVSQTVFAASLPELGKSLAVVREQKSSIPQSSIAEIQQKLAATSPTVPGYWPTAGELISYRSQLSGDIQQSGLPNCSKQPMQFTASGGTRTMVTVAVGSAIIKNCQLKLDSAEGIEVLSTALSAGGGGMTFENCLIFYGGGDIALHSVQMAPNSPALNPSGSVRFVNCLFVITLKSTPAPAGQRLTKELLTSTGNDVNFAPNT